jgi:hypothetical protein
MKRVPVLFLLLVCLVEMGKYMMIDYRLNANLQLLKSALHEVSQLDSGPLPNTATYLRKSGVVSLSEESSKNSSLRRPTPAHSVIDQQQIDTVAAKN